MGDTVSRVTPELTLQHSKSLADDHRDLYLYSGEIGEYGVRTLFFALYAPGKQRRDTASLILTTYGGDAGQAYRIARILQTSYSAFRLVVLSSCKSAGTLVAVGSDELAMGPLGELGPLDVQLRKPDELLNYRSGLDTLESLETLQSAAFDAFEDYMLALVQRSGGALSAKMACETASTIVTGLFHPIAEQIDPHRLSEVARAMRVTEEYGERLGKRNLKPGAIDKLIRGYPTHGFIIDYKESRSIFNAVHTPTDAEIAVLELHPSEALEPVGPHKASVFDITKEFDDAAEKIKGQKNGQAKLEAQTAVAEESSPTADGAK